MKTLGIGTICPKCGSSQFSISVPDIRPDDWPPNILGSADCRGCQQDFLVTLPLDLENAVIANLKNALSHYHQGDIFINMIREALF